VLGFAIRIRGHHGAERPDSFAIRIRGHHGAERPDSQEFRPKRAPSSRGAGIRSATAALAGYMAGSAA
jgi:hypothetical protein